MSMNLHCREVHLWQTPTYITYMCFSKKDGGWEGIRYRYIEWVKSHLNGAWDSNEELQDMKNIVKEHVEDLYSYKKLHFQID